MIDVLYVLGSGSKWNNQELRYSLRSLCRFAPGIGRVFVVGCDPGFLQNCSIHVVPDPTKTKEYNLVYQILWVCQNSEIGENFLRVDDDTFLVAPIDAETYPYYSTGSLDSKIEHARAPRYRTALTLTRDKLLSLGKPTVSFEPHAPIVLNRVRFKGLLEYWDESRRLKCGYTLRSFYCNYYGIRGTSMADCKMRFPHGPAEVKARLQGRHVFSIFDSAVALGVGEVLAEMFPEKCRFEA